jgi:death-on-curing protein
VIAFLTVDELIRVHDNVSSAPLIDRGKLEGAAKRPQATYGGEFLYSSIYLQASVLLHGICQAHGFLDGNKRTAWVATVTFLALNGLEIMSVSPETVADYMEEVAAHVHTELETAKWFVTLAC